MADQLRKVSGVKYPYRLKNNAVLEAKIARLPQLLANREKQKQIERDIIYQNKQIALKKKEMKQRKKEAKMGMGLDAAKLGITIGGMDGGIFGSTKGGSEGAAGVGAEEGGGSIMKSLKGFDYGGAAGAGLLGYGAGKLAGGKSKVKKALFGAGAGALSSLLGGGGGSFGSMLTNALTKGGIGGLGGFFS